MDKTKVISDGWGLPPLRSMTDFLGEKSRFQIPNFRDFEKWGNRVVNNLIYYQTNYLYMTVAIILIVGSMHPSKMFFGVLSMLAIWVQYLFVFSQNNSINDIKREYPKLQVILAVICAFFVIYTINSIFLLLFSLLLSFCVTFVHASLRLRNLKNKIVNKIEGLRLEHTPMGCFFKQFEDATGIALYTQTACTGVLQ